MPSFAATRSASRSFRSSAQVVESRRSSLFSASRRNSLSHPVESNIYVTLEGSVGAVRSGGNVSVFVAFESRSASSPYRGARRDVSVAVTTRFLRAPVQLENSASM